eukprot:758421-Hanusia_phi.AAC.2
MTGTEMRTAAIRRKDVGVSAQCLAVSTPAAIAITFMEIFQRIITARKIIRADTNARLQAACRPARYSETSMKKMAGMIVATSSVCFHAMYYLLSLMRFD